MNNTFDIKRFGNVFRKDLMENWKRYALLYITMLGIMSIVFIWASYIHYNGHSEGYSNNIYFNKSLLAYSSFMFAGFGIIFASTIMNPMNSKIKRIAYLINPASNFEKFLSRWLIMTVAYIILFFTALYIADFLRVGICSANFPSLDVDFLDIRKIIKANDNSKWSEYVFGSKYYLSLVLSFYFLFQSLFILGSTFWEKSTFIKTFAAMVVLIISFLLICRWTILLFYGDFDSFGNVMNSFESISNSRVSEEQGITFTIIATSFFTLSNWIFSYFRFRESEIIKRF